MRYYSGRYTNKGGCCGCLAALFIIFLVGGFVLNLLSGVISLLLYLAPIIVVIAAICIIVDFFRR